MKTLNMDLGRLVEIGGPRLGAQVLDATRLREWGSLGIELAQLLGRRNGFFAFESALLVRPLVSTGRVHGILDWNEPDFWRSAYEGLADGLLCFAEDVFGGQFCIGVEGVVAFDPETGHKEVLADSLGGWAAEILSDYEVLTGQPLAHSWQSAHGPLESEQRLVPKLPFVLGGQYELENLRVADSAESLRARASIAVQLRDLPDGSSIRVNLVD